MRYLTLATTALLLAPSVLAVKFHKFPSLLNENLLYADASSYSTAGFAVWATAASSSLLPILGVPGIEKQVVTILAPDTEAFGGFIQGRGGNWTDPGSLYGGEWGNLWNGLYPYFYVKQAFSPLNATAETTVLDTSLRSAIGDWPLRIGIRNDPAEAPAPVAANDTAPSTAANETAGAGNATTVVFNGTIVNTPYGTAPITIPDLAASTTAPLVTVQVFSYMPTVPQSLSKTVAAMNVSDWSEVVRRVPSLGARETQSEYTLFLPPPADISLALTRLNDQALQSYWNAHVVEQRIVLPLQATEYATVAGGSISVSINGISVVGGNGTVGVVPMGRDALLDGGIMQGLNASLVSIGTVAKRSLHIDL